MTELLETRPTGDVEPYDPSSHDGEIVQGEVGESTTETTLDQEARVDLPPQASLVDRAAHRLNRFAVNRAHSKALEMQSARDKAAQDEAYASYEENIQATADREHEERLEDEAYARNEKIDAKAARSERRSEQLSEMRGKLGKFGRNAISRLLRAGRRGLETTAGATIAGATKLGEKTGNGLLAGMAALDRGMDAAGARIDSVKETVADVRAAKRQEAERKAEAAATEKYERHAEKMKAKREKQTAKQERVDARLERARQAKEAAQARKAERRAKWASRREGLKQYLGDVREGAVETKDAAVKGAKFVGNTIRVNAEFANAAVREVSREQKAKLGRLAAKTRAARQGAIDSWKSV